MYKELLVVLLLSVSLSQIVLADDPMDDEIKVSKEVQTATPTTEPSVPTTTAPLQKSNKPAYMCLIYCVCGCLEEHCCSGCKRCSQDQLKEVFFSNMNTNENAAIGVETTVAP